jgi:steroid delta-isomerase-like uncharacterized protein
MAANYTTIVHEWFEEVWNKADPAAIDRLFAKDGIARGLPGKNGPDIRGPEEFKEFHAAFLKAFPDLRVEVLDVVSDGEKHAARCHVTGTHKGDGLGVGPTGKRVHFEGIGIARVKDGQIVEAWNNFDFMGMYQQLGCLTLSLRPV